MHACFVAGVSMSVHMQHHMWMVRIWLDSKLVLKQNDLGTGEVDAGHSLSTNP